MKIQKLTIINFKGIHNLTIEPNGANLNIFGDNATGKTTIADAFFFVLFGKDSLGQTDFDIKPIDPITGAIIHNLESTVELTLDDTLFTRTYRETYTKKRGSVTEEFTGHTTDYAIDGVPMQAKEYDARVAALCPEKTFRLLTDPTYFAGIKWQDRRKMLMEAFCGDVSDVDIIAANPALADLPAILGKRTPDDYIKVVKSEKIALNKKIDEIPARIDEANRNMPESMKVNGIEKGVLQEQLRKEQNNRAELLAGAGGAQYANDIAKAEAAITSWEAARRREYEDANAEIVADAKTKRANLREYETLTERLTRDIARDQRQEQVDADALQRLKADYKIINEAVYTGDTTCPTCKQGLPVERIEEAKANFNLVRATDLERNINQGKSKKKEWEETSHRLSTLIFELSKINVEVEQFKKELAAIDGAAPFAIDRSAPDYTALVNKRDRLITEQQEAQSGSASKVAAIDAEIANIQGQLNDISRAEQINAQRESTQGRIADLGRQQKDLAKQYEELSRHLYLLEEFTRAKCAMVTDVINKDFSMARFRLFEEQINGGIAECCEITYNGVPWGSLNNGSRVNVGLDIINTFSRKICLEDVPPVWIDNAESVTNIIPTDGQQIRLIVSAADKTLRVMSDTDELLHGTMTIAESREMYYDDPEILQEIDDTKQEVLF